MPRPAEIIDIMARTIDIDRLMHGAFGSLLGRT